MLVGNLGCDLRFEFVLLEDFSRVCKVNKIAVTLDEAGDVWLMV